jgi:beta-glucosidase-like glycosyl hydrolase
MQHRNWEGFGTDPYLQGISAAETIKGIQSSGVMATAKHFILKYVILYKASMLLLTDISEQEHFRQILEWSESPDNAISSNVDDRTMHELYLWPFADSVRAGVASVMCSYNQINNTYACGNSKAMNGLLKDELGFQVEIAIHILKIQPLTCSRASFKATGMLSETVSPPSSAALMW